MEHEFSSEGHAPVIGLSNILTCFDDVSVGSKVVKRDEFFIELVRRVEECEQDGDFKATGQMLVALPDALHTVTSGVALRSDLAVDEYIVREYRDEVGLFAPRRKALPTEGLSAVVYTLAAYLADPEVDAGEQTKFSDECTHVLVAVLATAGPKPPLSSHRFVRNLAGGNNRFKPENGYDLEQAIREAIDIVAYELTYVTVAD